MSHHKESCEHCGCVPFERSILMVLWQMQEMLKDLSDRIPRRAVSAVLTFEGVTMATIHLNGKGATAVFTEFDGANGTGSVVPPTGSVTFTSSDHSIATIDPTSGAITAVAAGTVTITGTDSGNGLIASDSLPVTAAVAVSATLVITAN